MSLKYSFKTFILNGLGADFLRICKIYFHCNKHNIKLYMDHTDDWRLVPEKMGIMCEQKIVRKTWRSFFNSLEMTSDENIQTKTIQTINEAILNQVSKDKITFDELKAVALELFKPNYIFNNMAYPLLDCPNNKYAVIHIRRGDKVSGSWREGQLHLLDEYYSKIKDKYSEKDIFIMTDSPDVSKEAFERGFQIDMSEVRRDGFVYNHYKNPYPDPVLFDEAATFFKNMKIFKNGEILVGSNSSYFYVLGQLLNNKPGISLSDNMSYYVFG